MPGKEGGGQCALAVALTVPLCRSRRLAGSPLLQLVPQLHSIRPGVCHFAAERLQRGGQGSLE